MILQVGCSRSFAIYPGPCVSWCFKIQKKNIWGVASAKKVSLNLRGESFNKRLGLSECFLKSNIFVRNFPSKPLGCWGKASQKNSPLKKDTTQVYNQNHVKKKSYKNHHQLSWIFLKFPRDFVWDGKFRMS